MNNDDGQFSWSSEEFEVWKNAGLIPKDLLAQSQYAELVAYLQRNKQALISHYREPLSKIKTPEQPCEIQVIDREQTPTGELEKRANFEICDGVSLEVQAKEYNQWQMEAASADKLTKEQKKDLKRLLEAIKDRPLTRQEIINIIEEIRRPQQAKKIRQAGHFVDRKLEYQDPQSSQLSLFDTLSPQLREKMEGSKLEVKAVGIRLTPSEDKLINALYKLLHDKSETQDVNSDQFYGGNQSGQLVQYGDDGKTARSIFLKIKPTELYQEYLGEDNYSGKEIENIRNLLYGLNEKKFLIIYDRKRKVKKGDTTENRTDRIEDFQSLIKVVTYIEGLTDAEVLSLDSDSNLVREQKGELVIAMNPLLTDQINSKYVEYPTDINQRTVIASGGHRQVTESIISLRDYMLRERSAKRHRCEINADKLPYILKLENYVKSHRKKLISQRIDDAINAVKKLGLVNEVEILTGTMGQAKYVFSLNPNFE